MLTPAHIGPPRDFRLQVGGMTGASCVLRVEKALKKLPGVRDASVNLATEEATVKVDDGMDPSMLVQAVRKAGYEVPPSFSSSRLRWLLGRTSQA